MMVKAADREYDAGVIDHGRRARAERLATVADLVTEACELVDGPVRLDAITTEISERLALPESVVHDDLVILAAGHQLSSRPLGHRSFVIWPTLCGIDFGLRAA